MSADALSELGKESGNCFARVSGSFVRHVTETVSGAVPSYGLKMDAECRRLDNAGEPFEQGVEELAESRSWSWEQRRRGWVKCWVSKADAISSAMGAAGLPIATRGKEGGRCHDAAYWARSGGGGREKGKSKGTRLERGSH